MRGKGGGNNNPRPALRVRGNKPSGWFPLRPLRHKILPLRVPSPPKPQQHGQQPQPPLQQPQQPQQQHSLPQPSQPPQQRS
ncbi:hypothetical protein E3J74_02265 [Candidatus Bathyarchaeota archaeon]|nr:MAG: hypothetical protein E3J74_02265 [Candidatus Bathyarchaeota archaeon]